MPIFFNHGLITSNMMKINKQLIAALAIALPLVLGGCAQQTPGVDLDRVMRIALESMQRYEQTHLGSVSGSMDEQAMSAFSRELSDDLRMAQPPLYSGPISVLVANDGSIQGYHDRNANYVRETGEEDLFKIEVDSSNQRIIASHNGEVRDQGLGMGSGFLMGMLMGSLLNRQSAAGIRPGAFDSKRATPKRPRTSYSSARSRAGSGSFSSGK
jgi:hypothetical protein